MVHPEVKSPVMTGQWEAYLHRIQRGTAELVPFMKGIEDYVREVVGKVGGPSRDGGPSGSACPTTAGAGLAVLVARAVSPARCGCTCPTFPTTSRT